jgi:hypothetical protein
MASIKDDDRLVTSTGSPHTCIGFVQTFVFEGGSKLAMDMSKKWMTH